MPTDTDKTLNGTPEPFRRPVVWGRPPATVFRAGPLPKGGVLPPLPEPSRRAAGSGILSGSLVPRAAPGPTPASTPVPEAPEPPVAAAPEPRPAIVPATPSKDHAADLTVRPLPPLEPEPAEPATPLQFDTLPAFQPTVRSDTERSAGPGPAGGDTVRNPASRAPLYAGVAAALALLALAGWFWTRPPAGAPAAAAAVAPAAALPAASAPLDSPPTPVAVIEAPPVVLPPVAATLPVRPAGTRPAPAPAPTTTRTAPAVVARPPAPMAGVVAPPPAVVPAPLIEIVPAPPPGPPPTEAERPPSDPDAPIATRPQPIG